MSERVLTVKLIKTSPPNETIFALGTQGSGKTTLIANLVLDKKRYVIFDTKQDFPPEEFQEAIVIKTRSEFQAAINTQKEKLIVQLWHDEDPEKFLNDCCADLMRLHTLNQKNGLETWVLIDELNKFVFVGHCGEGLSDISLRGRSIGIKKIYGAQWFATIPAWMRDGFSEIYCFAHTDENGLDKLAVFGFDVDEVKNLPQHVCMYRGKGKMERVSLVPDKATTNNKGQNK